MLAWFGFNNCVRKSKRFYFTDKSYYNVFSGVSMYNFNDEEEDEDAPSREKLEENEQLKEKMKQIRLNMDKLNISKKVGSQKCISYI